MTENDDLLINIVRALSAVFALAAAYYAGAFMYRYRKVAWKGSAWGRHIYGFARMVVVVMATAVLLRLARIIGWDLEAPLITATFGLVVYAWVAVQMRARYHLERETNEQKAEREKAFLEEGGTHE